MLLFQRGNHRKTPLGNKLKVTEGWGMPTPQRTASKTAIRDDHPALVPSGTRDSGTASTGVIPNLRHGLCFRLVFCTMRSAEQVVTRVLCLAAVVTRGNAEYLTGSGEPAPAFVELTKVHPKDAPSLLNEWLAQEGLTNGLSPKEHREPKSNPRLAKKRTPPPNGSGVHDHFCLSFSLGGCFLGGGGGVFGLASGAAGRGACL